MQPAGKPAGGEQGPCGNRRSLRWGEMDQADGDVWRRPLRAIPIKVLPFRFR
jgi:hypothetical protein